MWSAEEKEILIKNHQLKNTEIEKLLPGKSIHAITSQKNRLGLVHQKSWTLDEDKILIDYYYYMSSNDLGLLLPDRTKRAIVSRAQILGLSLNRSIDKKLELFINKNSGVFGEDGKYFTECWIWTGYIDVKGYGIIQVNKIRYKAHRFIFELFKNKIPDNLCLDHLCRVRGCVNPDHMDPKTIGENVLAGNSIQAFNKNKTHCIRNHEFTHENTYIDFRGSRCCRICKKL